MQKLIYLLWRAENFSRVDFAAVLLREVAPRFVALGAERISCLIEDEFAAQVARARITKLAWPPSAMLAFWIPSLAARAPYEALLAEVCARFAGKVAGYHVEESRPLENTTHGACIGERTPGITMLSLLERPARISHADWIAYWHGPHQQVALETQSTYLYIRNVVCAALTPEAPAWAGIVEEGFPTEAVTNPMLWYRADGSKEKLKANVGRMIESCRKFLDLERVESHPMSEYRIKE